MAQPQQNISIRAPGFMGMNTQDSPTEQDISYAAQADNCVIDKSGRIAARKGFVGITLNPSVLGGNPVETVFEFIDDDGTQHIFACGNNQIFKQDTSNQQVITTGYANPFTISNGNMTAMTIEAGHPGIVANNWQICSFAGKCYFVQAGHEPLVFDPSGYTHVASDTTLYRWSQNWGNLDNPPLPSTQYPNSVTAAFGQLVVTAFDNENSVACWSNLADGESWASGSPTGGAGAIDLMEFWPIGYDTVVTARAHNNFFIYFGKRSMLVYQLPNPSTGFNDQFLADTIEGIGCIARDSVQPTGTDMLFVDATGVRSLGRTIQQKSVAIGDLSYNVRSDFKLALSFEPEDDIKSVYHPEDSFYATFLPSNPKTYVFDTRVQGQKGEARATQWVNVVPVCSARTEGRGTLFGGKGGLYLYTGYNDYRVNDDDTTTTIDPVEMAYYTHPQTWDQPAGLKFPKQVDVTVIGGVDVELCLDWAFDYGVTYNSLCQTFTSGVVSFYNEDAEYGTEYEYSGGSGINRLKYNVWGSGTNVRVGFRANTNGGAFSIQELNIQTLLGRTL